jgi:hypothetical protein
VVFGIGMWAYDQGDLNTERLSKLMGLPFQGKATNVAQRSSHISAAGVDQRPGCRDGSIRHGGDQLPDGLRRQSGKLRRRAGFPE